MYDSIIEKKKCEEIYDMMKENFQNNNTIKNLKERGKKESSLKFEG